MKCRSCKSTNIKEIFSMGDVYLSDFINPTDSKPPKFPLNLVLCKDCTLVQLKETTPSDQLYTPRYGYRSGISNTMKLELEDIVRCALKMVTLNPQDMVVDIGANDGTLLSFYRKDLLTIGVEPVKKFALECAKIATDCFNGFFSYKPFIEIGKKAKIITAISMFYDLEDPNSFVSDVAQLLDEDGVFVIQQNYLVNMIKNRAFDNIVHEHLEYYSLTSLEPLLNRHGLEVVDVMTDSTNGGSFRTYVKHSHVNKMREEEKKLHLDSQYGYLLFEMGIKEIKENLFNLIKGLVKSGKTVYVLGASTRGNTLLQYCGLDNTLITAAMERNQEKWGKKIASLDIPIVSEEQARKDKPDYMLVLPWFFRNEIIKREEAYLKAGGHLIIPLPKVEVI